METRKENQTQLDPKKKKKDGHCHTVVGDEYKMKDDTYNKTEGGQN